MLVFFLTKFFILFFQENIWWDSAVYIGIGKYIFSYGNSGLWEPSRPLIWPLILGFFWKLGFDAVFFRILELLFATGCIYLTYLIAKKTFNNKIALFSALFLAFSPTFYFFSTISLSGIPSLFFALLSIYFFMDKKYFLTGIFSGLAFMTRFLQLFIFIIILLILILYFKKNKVLFKNILKIVIGFFIIITPYLIFNYIAYNDVFYPFIIQNFMTENTGFIFHQSFWFYFVGLLKENYLSIISILGFYIIIKKSFNVKDNNEFKEITITTIFLIFFVFLNLIKHKEIRILIIVLPYLYIITSYSLYHITKKIKIEKTLFYSLIILIFSIWFLQSFSNIYILEYNEVQQKNKYSAFQKYLNSNNIQGNIWISNPILALYTDKKIEELIYYPTFDTEKYNELKNKMKQSNHILIDTCDIACEPIALNCIEEKSEFLILLKENLNQVYFDNLGDCKQFIFNK